MNPEQSINPHSIRVRDFDRTVNGFVQYLIEFQLPTEHPQNKARFWSVNRRYSDFVFLRDQLRITHPASIIPPLPGKSDIFSTIYQAITSQSPQRFGNIPSKLLEQALAPGYIDSIVIEYRCYAFQVFLRQVFSHPILKKHTLLERFMYQEGDWTNSNPHLSHTLSLPGGTVSPSISETAPHNILTQTVPPDEPTRPPSILCCLLNSKLLKDRASALRTTYQHMDSVVVRLTDIVKNTHHLHKNYADALCQWAPHENQPLIMAETLQMIGHELDSYSSIMDPAEEEDVELRNQFAVWANYANSLVEVQKFYEHLQNERTKRLRPVDLTDDSPNVSLTPAYSETVNPDAIVSSQRKASSEFDLAHVSRQMLDEISYFESVHNTNLHTMLHTLVAFQMKRADRCRRIWLRILNQLKQTDQALQSYHSA